MMEATAGLPRLSFGDGDGPSFDNATWFSTTGEPPCPDISDYVWEYDLKHGWVSEPRNRPALMVRPEYPESYVMAESKLSKLLVAVDVVSDLMRDGELDRSVYLVIRDKVFAAQAELAREDEKLPCGLRVRMAEFDRGH